jgi:hypothetical protein
LENAGAPSVETRMTLARLAKRRDANEGDLILAARALGAKLWPLDTPADWLLLWCGRWYPVEIKSQTGKLTKAQIDFRLQAAVGHGWVITWRTLDDVVSCLNQLRERAIRES